MHDRVAEYIDSRFSALESLGFEPIASSRCLRVNSTLSWYWQLTREDQARFRGFVARTRVGFWRTEAAPMENDPDHLWHVRCGSAWALQAPDERRCLARAPELRKVARLCFEQLLGAKPRKSEEPGVWLYEGAIDGVPVSVQIGYANTMTQMRYGVRMEGMAPYVWLSAEMLYGLGVGWWNRVYVDDVDQAFALLRQLVLLVVHDHLEIYKLTRTKA